MPGLLLKSISDKKFIRDAAKMALALHAETSPQMYTLVLTVRARLILVQVPCIRQLLRPQKCQGGSICSEHRCVVPRKVVQHWGALCGLDDAGRTIFTFIQGARQALPP